MTQLQEGKMVSKTSSLKALLMRGWRERWPASQWGIRIKTVLPRGGSGDAYNLAEILLTQSLVSPIPNPLILSYLKHALGSHLVSVVSVLQAAVKTGLDPRKPRCTEALLDLLETSVKDYLRGGKGEECVALALSLLSLATWLLKVYALSLQGSAGKDDTQIHESNSGKSLKLMQSLILDKEFVLALFYVGKLEDKECYYKMVAQSKAVSELSKDYPSSRSEILRITAALKTSTDSLYSGEKSDSFSLTSAIQPLLAFEALLHPTSDLSSLSHYLNTLALVHHLSFSDLAYEVMRSLLLSLSVKEEGFELLKWDAFILVRFPHLLDKLYRLSTFSTSGSSNGAVVEELKTPTDLYKAFDKLLKNESLFDSVDVRCKCSIIDVFLKVVSKCSTPLMTETEMEDVRKKRSPVMNEPTSINLQEMVSSRNFEMMSKAEVTIVSILKTLDNDYSKPDSLENLLGVLCHIIKGESFDLLLAASAANGQLKPFIQSMAKFNQQSQESQGESVKNSCLRAALFDITFLMLVHVVQTFGSEIVIKEAKGTFIERWIKEMLTEDDRVKCLQQTGDNMVDNLLSQLSLGELRTQVVKWQNVCVNIHLVMKEMIVARSLGDLNTEAYSKMVTTLCGRLCAISVCVISWLTSFELSIPGTSQINVKALKNEFVDIALKSGLNGGTDEPGGVNEMPHAKERVALMSTIFKKILRHEEKKRIVCVNSSLKESLLKIWDKVSRTGWLDIDAVLKIKELFRIGGAQWLTECLIDELLKVVYQEDMEKLTELVISIFHIDLEECTLGLLLHVVPGYLSCSNKVLRLTDPHGSLLAKVTVSCIYAILMSNEKKSKKPNSCGITSVPPAQHKGYYSPEDYYSAPATKIRKLEGEECPDSEDGFLSQAVSEFLRILQSSVSDSCVVTPKMHFAVRFLEQSTIRGRSRAARLIFSRLNMSTITHLIKVVPDLFTYGLVTKLFDATSSSGRKNMSRVLCLLKNVKTRTEVC